MARIATEETAAALDAEHADGSDSCHGEGKAALTDQELLTSFVEQGSQEALTELLKRHTPKVYGTCLRILGDPHAAEDATQATFIVLTRKASRLKKKALLADWLFWTAKNCALDLRKKQARRARHEQEAVMAKSTETPAEPQAAWDDVRVHLDVALAALPASQREAAVLHFIYGKSQMDIARESGSPQTTIARRISSALEKLRQKLAGKGFNVTVPVLTGWLTEKTVEATPAGLLESVQAACMGATGASVTALAVADGAIKAAKIAQLKVASVIVSTALVVGGGSAAVTHELLRTASPVLEDDAGLVAQLEGLKPSDSMRLPECNLAGLENVKISKTLRRKLKDGPGLRYKSPRMAYAPDRRAAFYCGGTSMYATNDVWEYHLGSNTWKLTSPPDGDDHRDVTLAYARIKQKRDVEKNQAFVQRWFRENVEFTDGYLRTRGNGGPVYPPHVWDSLTWDASAGRLYWVLTADYQPPLAAFARETGHPSGDLWKKRVEHTTLWSYSPGADWWRPNITQGPRPRTLGMGGSLVHDTKRNRLVWYVAATNVLPHEYQMWSFDLGTGAWTDLQPNGGKDLEKLCKEGLAPTGEIQAAYSPKQDRIIAVFSTKTWAYDCVANEWTSVAKAPENRARSAETVFVYASKPDTFILAQPKRRQLRAYDPATNEWRTLPIHGSQMPAKICAGYYDPRFDLLVLYDGSRKPWVYRYDG